MIGVIAYLMLQSQYEADQRDSHHQDQQHEDIFRGSRQQNSGKLIFVELFLVYTQYDFLRNGIFFSVLSHCLVVS